LYLGTEVKDESWGAKFLAVWKREISTFVWGWTLGRENMIRFKMRLSASGFWCLWYLKVSSDNTKWAVYNKMIQSQGKLVCNTRDKI
jgi:hypothetical protein